MFITDSPVQPADTAGAGSGNLLDRNALTTAGVCVAAGTGVAGAAVLVAALPAQMLTAGALTGGLLYAGHRQYVGKPILPSFGQADASVTVTATASTDAPAAQTDAAPVAA